MSSPLHLARLARLSPAGSTASARSPWRWAWREDQRNFTVMKNSWPKLRPPPDPNKPSISSIMRQMDSNKSQSGVMARSAPATDRRRHAQHLPACVYPTAAATPGAVSPERPAGPNRGGRDQATGASTMVPPASWRPPGWEAIAKQRGVPTSSTGPARGPRRRKDTLGEDRPAFEVWGMRLVTVLVLGVLYVELSTVSWGPTGLTRKPRGHVVERPDGQAQ